MLPFLSHEFVILLEGLLAVIELEMNGHAVLLKERHAFLGLGEFVGMDVDDLIGQFIRVLSEGV